MQPEESRHGRAALCRWPLALRPIKSPNPVQSPGRAACHDHPRNLNADSYVVGIGCRMLGIGFVAFGRRFFFDPADGIFQRQSFVHDLEF